MLIRPDFFRMTIRMSGLRQSGLPAVPGTSACGWLRPRRWRSLLPCSPGCQCLQLAVTWETEKLPTPWSRVPAPAAWGKPPAHHSLWLQPAQAKQTQAQCLWLDSRREARVLGAYGQLEEGMLGPGCRAKQRWLGAIKPAGEQLGAISLAGK